MSRGAEVNPHAGDDVGPHAGDDVGRVPGQTIPLVRRVLLWRTGTQHEPLGRHRQDFQARRLWRRGTKESGGFI